MPTNGSPAMTIGHSNHPMANSSSCYTTRSRPSSASGPHPQQVLPTSPQQSQPGTVGQENRLHLRRRNAGRPAGPAGALHARGEGRTTGPWP